MGRMFKNDGTLKIPLAGEVPIPEESVEQQDGQLIVQEAYCAQGHNLMSPTRVNDRPGIHFLYTDQTGTRSADIVISSRVGDCAKAIVSGEPFNEGEIIRVLCPSCRLELPVLMDCECGAPIYLFFIDKSLDHNYGQSFCSRVGCVRASRLRFSRELMTNFITNYCF